MNLHRMPGRQGLGQASAQRLGPPCRQPRRGPQGGAQAGIRSWPCAATADHEAGLVERIRGRGHGRSVVPNFHRQALQPLGGTLGQLQRGHPGLGAQIRQRRTLLCQRQSQQTPGGGGRQRTGGQFGHEVSFV